MATRLPYTVRAEVRAVEQGHKAFDNGDGSFRVVSDTRDGVRYTVTPRISADPEGWCLISCTCPAATQALANRYVPCKHAALVGRRLEREGRLRFDVSLSFWVTPGERPKPTKDEIDALFKRVRVADGLDL